MRLNKECVRDLLLAMEEMEHDEVIYKEDLTTNPRLNKYDFYEVVYAIEKLIEANFINGRVNYADNDVHSLLVSSLTWEGHQFLDNIRDDSVWKSTKNIASKFSSVSLNMLGNIASSIISKMISNELKL